MKRVLITGAAGFVGANLAIRGLAEGNDVCAVLRPGSDRWRLESIERHLRVIETDLRDGASVSRTVAEARPDWVFHTAAYGAYSWQTDAAQIVATNVDGTTNLLQACARAGVEAFVHAGSSSEYGRCDHPAVETDPAAPESDYAVSKLRATECCRSFADSQQLSTITLRLYSVFGPLEDPRRLVPALIVHGLSGRLPPLADPASAHDFVHIEDVCEAFVRAATAAPTGASTVYNVGTGRQTTLADLVELVRALLPIDAAPDWHSMPSRAWDTNVWVANPERAARECGWRAAIGLADGLRRFVDWFRDNPAMLDYYRRRHGLALTAPSPNAC
jgi:nucleoside-diphosphate-sugar epimerase